MAVVFPVDGPTDPGRATDKRAKAAAQADTGYQRAIERERGIATSSLVDAMFALKRIADLQRRRTGRTAPALKDILGAVRTLQRAVRRISS